MRLKIRKINVWRLDGSYRLQAASELAVARVLEGRTQSMIVYGQWNLTGVVLGFYQSSRGVDGVVARRATGGGSTVVKEPTSYASIIIPSTSLRATVDVAKELSECLGVGFSGVTRIGPITLSAGVIELLGDFQLDQLLDCSKPITRKPRVVEARPPYERITDVAKAYATREWIQYEGSLTQPLVGEARRGDYMVRVGVSLYEGKFISEARIDGNFYAAPPAEPFSTIAGIQGMPLGDQVYLALEARFSSGLEIYGVEPEDVTLALRRAVNAK